MIDARVTPDGEIHPTHRMITEGLRIMPGQIGPSRASETALSRRAAILSMAALALTGCGYTLRPPFAENVRTVYVPMFRSTTYRRDLNQQLTLLVCQEIERRTPYKVVGKPEGADTTLQGSVDFAEKNIIVENPFNLPRQLVGTIVATVSWTDNRVGDARKVNAPAAVSSTVNFFPEIGESTEAAFYRVNQELAQQIVNMMEERWDLPPGQ